MNENTTISGGQRIITLVSNDDRGKRVPAYNPEKNLLNHKSLTKYIKSAYEGATATTLVEKGIGTPKEVEFSSVWKRHADKNIAVGALDDDSTVFLAVAKHPDRTLVVDLKNRLTAAKSAVYTSRLVADGEVEFRNAADLLVTAALKEDFLAYVRTETTPAALIADDIIEEYFDRVLADSRNFTPKKIDGTLPTDFDRVRFTAKSWVVDTSLEGRDEDIATTLNEASIDELQEIYDNLSGDDAASRLPRHRFERIILSRAYNDFLAGVMQKMADIYQQRKYERGIVSGETATVYQEKKNIPETHLEAAANSVFRKMNDFREVEVDESIDLTQLKAIEEEWKRLREILPHVEKKAALRFRKTGRHKAIGVYHPAHKNIAVDPRHPHSFVHEYLHHVDYATHEGKLSQLSLSAEYAPLLHKIQAEMRSHPELSADKKLDYYTTPTEVFARGGELALAWSGISTSLNGDAETFEQPAYQAYEPFRDEILSYYREHLGIEQIQHEQPRPRPQLRELSETGASQVAPPAVGDDLDLDAIQR